MGVSVNNRAVGGGFRSTFDPAAGATDRDESCACVVFTSAFSPVRAHQPVLSMQMRGVKSVCASPSKSWISLEECSEQAAQERMRVRVLSAGINKDGRRVSASCTNTTRYPEHVARW